MLTRQIPRILTGSRRRCPRILHEPDGALVVGLHLAHELIALGDILIPDSLTGVVVDVKFEASSSDDSRTGRRVEKPS
jgi:hypothetical protein